MPPACIGFAGKCSSGQAEIARFGKMANAAENTPRGTVIDMESYRTSSLESEGDQTPRPIPNGPVSIVTEPCDTKAHSGALSDAERLKLAKIRRNRNLGWMPTFEEFDFLLEVVERMSRGTV
jgi:hypothetical protein